MERITVKFYGRDRKRSEAMTPEEFKKRWDSGPEGGGITFDDIAQCAKAWGICERPLTRPIGQITNLVLKRAGVKQ